MNIITQIATKITAPPAENTCDISATNFTDCKDVGDLRSTLNTSVPFWKQAVIAFRLIAALFFLKQVFTIFKEVMAGAPLKAVKAGAYGALGLFLLFDIGNTLFVIMSLRTYITKAIESIQDTIKKSST